MRTGSPRATGPDAGGAERHAAVGPRPTDANAGGAECSTAVGTAAAALGMLTRGIIAGEMTDPRNTWDGARETRLPEGTRSRWSGSCCQVLVPIPSPWRLRVLDLSASN